MTKIQNYWEEFKSENLNLEDRIDLEKLITKFNEFRRGLKFSNNKKTKELYIKYLEYFDLVDMKNIIANKSFQRLVDIDQLKLEFHRNIDLSDEFITMNIRDIFWDLLTHKTNICLLYTSDAADE